MEHIEKSGQYKSEDVIDMLIQKTKQGLSRVGTFNFLKNELGLSQAQAYKYMRDASDKIAEIYKDVNVNALQDTLNHLEQQRDEALAEKNRKLALEITKEINALMGLHTKKVEHSGSIESVNTIKIVEVIKDEGTDTGNADHEGVQQESGK